MKRIQVNEPGGAREACNWRTFPRRSPGPKALVRLAASGVNFIDVYFRIGLYKADLPITLGNEGAGTVEAVGAGVTEVGAGRSRGLCHGARLLCGIRRGAGVAYW